MDEPPTADAWLHETKYDGYRFIATKHNNTVRMMTRNQQDWSAKFSELTAELQKNMNNGDILDGEVVVLNEKGQSRFRLLQQALSNESTSNAIFFIFDILAHKYVDIRRKPLILLKKILADVVSSWPSTNRLRLSQYIEGSVKDMYQEACKVGLEGLVSKKIDAPYPAGRSSNWVKTKCNLEEEFLIIGYTEPEGNRELFGALLLAQKDERGSLIYRGKVGTGFNERESRDLFKKLIPLKIDKNPTGKPLPPIARRTKIYWVKPKLIAQIEYTEQTEVGVLRHPSFIGIREDKAPDQVVIEKPKHMQMVDFKLTSPDKLMYKHPKTTKQDLIDYYKLHADWILPFIAQRPLSLMRCPDGSSGTCFFQRNDRGMFPEAIHHKTQRGDAIMWIEDITGLLTLVQFGVLEIHTWGCEVSNVDKPDLIVFDLDPGEDARFDQLKQAALHVRQFLSAMDLQCFVKTSGKKGLHICAPIQPTLPWDDIKQFTKQVAESLEQRFPKLYTSKITKTTRSGKIFIDYLRNQRSATFIAPYSTRVASEPVISMPFHWDHLNQIERANAFTIAHAPYAPEDAWPGFFTLKQTITKKLLNQLMKWAKAA